MISYKLMLQYEVKLFDEIIVMQFIYYLTKSKKD